MEDDTDTKVKLEDLIPVPQRRRAETNRKPRSKHPSYILTEGETLEFIRSKDKDFVEVLKCKQAAEKTRKKPKMNPHVRRAINEKPQPWFDGEEGMVCVLCYGEFGEKDQLGCEDKWVQCPWCYVWFHHDCLRVVKDCTCGERIRLKRKPSV